MNTRELMTRTAERAAATATEQLRQAIRKVFRATLTTSPMTVADHNQVTAVATVAASHLPEERPATPGMPSCDTSFAVAVTIREHTSLVPPARTSITLPATQARALATTPEGYKVHGMTVISNKQVGASDRPLYQLVIQGEDGALYATRYIPDRTFDGQVTVTFRPAVARTVAVIEYAEVTAEE